MSDQTAKRFLNRNVFTWLVRIGYSIADQGLVSGANFALNILLAKWISPEDYGLFGITFALFLFLSGFHNALIIEPLVVIGPSRYSEQTSAYLVIAIYIHVIFALLNTVILLLSTPLLLWWMGSFSFGMLIALAVACFSILLFWLLRRAAYLHGNAAFACLGSFSYTVTLLAGLFYFRNRGWLTGVNAYWLMSGASLVASGVLWRYLGIDRKQFFDKDRQITISSVLHEHWRYGRWIVAGTLAYSLGTLIYVPLVGVFVGLATSGVFRAMQNLVQPAQQITVALSTFFVPWLSKQRNLYGPLYPLKALSRILLLFFAVGAIFLLPLILFNQELVRLIYDNKFYQDYAWVLYYIAISTMSQMLVYAMATVVRSMEYSNVIFWEELAGALFVITIGIVLIWQWGLLGASISLVGSTLCQLLLISWFVRRKLQMVNKYE